MPRYRFRWENIDEDLRDRLAERSRRTGPAAVAWLQASYGMRPKVAFVADQWPVLRDRWLAEAAPARTNVVAGLRSFGLGDGAVDVGDRDGQLAYLHSCRNQPRLRSVVLQEFIRAGEQAPEPMKPRPPTPTWEEFGAALAAALAAIAPGQYLIISVRGSGTEHDDEGYIGAAHFVQFAVGEDGSLRAEAVANAFLVGDERLSRPQIAALVTMGWDPPTYAPGDPAGEADEGGSPNFYRDWTDPPYAEVAELAWRTLHEVHGAETPAVLQYTALDERGTPVDLPPLGIEAEVPAPVTPDPARLLPTPSSREELLGEVLRTLEPVVTTPEIQFDAEGDIPIRWGSTVVFVRVFDEIPLVRLFAPVLTDVVPSTRLFDTINDINRRYLAIKAVWDGASVVLVADIAGSPYVGPHVLSSLSALGTAADEIDDELQAEFGGRTFFATPLPPPAIEESGGYL